MGRKREHHDDEDSGKDGLVAFRLQEEPDLHGVEVHEEEEDVDVGRFWSCSLSLTPLSLYLPCSGDKESHTCSS